MISVHTIQDMRTALAPYRQQGKTIGFVPTMGNLHAGHLHLIERARQLTDVVVASIFVNPLQFGAGEDFGRYPRTLDADREKLEAADCDILFAPQTEEIYPHGEAEHTKVDVPGFEGDLCGAFRPGHFRGVATVVARLLGSVGPCTAVFGKKDYQQFLMIRKMVADLCLPVVVIGVDTRRDGDGLALSSRNAYLTPEQRRQASHLYETLQDAARHAAQGKDLSTIEHEAVSRLDQDGFRPEYVAIRRQQDLRPPKSGDTHLIILAAAWLGTTRLIDNVESVIG